VRNEEVFQTVKEEKNTLQTVKRRMAAWTGHMLCGNCLLVYFSKVNESRNWPGVTQRVPGGLGSHISMIFGT
jgi:hypothetical protein